jgi:hypothetical protein
VEDVMKADLFKKRMKELSVLCRSDQSMELFNTAYEELLAEVKQEMDTARRTEQVVKMKLMLRHQAVYLLTIREEAQIREGISDDGEA